MTHIMTEIILSNAHYDIDCYRESWLQGYLLFSLLSWFIFGFVGTLRGPDDTPYAKGTFEVDIIIPDDYPFTPPKMRFITKRT